MTERDHNGEPILTKQLPITTRDLRQFVHRAKDGIPRAAIYSKACRLDDERRELIKESFSILGSDLSLIINESLDSLNTVTALDPYQKLRVHEALANAVVVTAETVSNYLDESVYKACGQNAVEDIFYMAVESVDEKHHGLIADLWSEISN